MVPLKLRPVTDPVATTDVGVISPNPMVIVPLLVIGLPLTVTPFNPEDATEVTVPLPSTILVQEVFVPFVVKNIPLLPVCDGTNALNAAFAVVCPVPPFAIPNVPASVIVPFVVIGDPETVKPVVPPDNATDVTVPVLLV